MARFILPAFAALSLMACTGEAAAPVPMEDGSIVSEDGLKLVPIAEGLEFPWGIAELPDGALLVTEREGRLRLIDNNGLNQTPISGIPDDLLVLRQGGLLGITLAPDFESSRTLYLAYSKGTSDENTTAVISATLSEDRTELENVTEIFTGAPRATGFHFGSRIVVLPDGSLAIGLGDGGRYQEESQDPNNRHGVIARVMPDGSIPADNPFVDGGGDPAVWSYGHRNVQGMIYDETRDILFAHEHGPKGGDELNVVKKGANYGWPTITYGINYDGSIITTETEAPGMEQPIVKWVPSIAPSGMTLVQTEGFEDWAGDLMVGGMNGPAGQKLVRVDLDENGNVVETVDLLEDLPIAYRDVISTPSAIYVATTDLDGFVYRLETAE
ncbi:MAG: PQQ-dependent sugar dehydrogenase [Pseudomonadota bacterium]